MSKAELLLPAGNIEKMQYAIAYGADAVYLGIVDFSLRSMKAGNVITLENIKEAIKTAHQMGAKAYVTVNIFANNDDIEKLPALLEVLQDEKPEGIIFGDPGFYSILKGKLPDIPLHISTQANTLNYSAVKFWQDLGISRVILGRELSLSEIETISAKVPDIELEVLVHGSLCVSYSGRCLLSDYFTSNKRKSNKGNCTQPCRWSYHLVEENRPGRYFEITEDEKGTYILNPKDLALIKYIPDLINAGVNSFKIEGRTKSLYYASVVAKTYKQAIDSYYKCATINADELFNELAKTNNRQFMTGFLADKPDFEHYNYNSSKGITGATFVGVIEEHINDNKYLVKLKNQLKKGSTVECITPNGRYETIIESIIMVKGENEVNVANTNYQVYLDLNLPEYIKTEIKWAILRYKE